MSSKQHILSPRKLATVKIVRALLFCVLACILVVAILWPGFWRSGDVLYFMGGVLGPMLIGLETGFLTLKLRKHYQAVRIQSIVQGIDDIVVPLSNSVFPHSGPKRKKALEDMIRKEAAGHARGHGHLGSLTDALRDRKEAVSKATKYWLDR